MGSPEQDQRRISRREFVRLAFLTMLAAGLGGKVLVDEFQSRYYPSAPEAKDLEPTHAINGVVAVYEGANIRTSPQIPDKTRLRKPDNTIDWEEIEAVNGVKLGGAKAFVIVNALAVRGQFVGHFYKESASNLDEKTWMKIIVEKKDRAAIPAYISYSFQTREFVTPLEGGFYIEGLYIDQYGYARTRDPEFGLPLLVSLLDFGRVIVPKNSEAVARQVMPDLWAARVRPKLEGKLPLSGRERIFENVRVIAAGDSWAEVVKMQKEGTPVNVRDYPARWYRDGEPTRILGRIPQGTRIKKVLSSG